MVEKASGMFEKAAFLGPRVSARERPALEIMAKEIRDNVLLFVGESDEEKERRNMAGIALLEQVVPGARSYKDAKNIIGMSEDCGDDVSDMEAGLERLTTTLTYAMVYGANRTRDDAVHSGLPSTVDIFLPESLVGFGEEIVKRVITNEDVRRVLKKIDDKYSGIKLLPGEDRNIETLKVLGKARMRLVKMAFSDRLIPEGHDDRGELERTVAYLSTMIEDREEFVRSRIVTEGGVVGSRVERPKKGKALSYDILPAFADPDSPFSRVARDINFDVGEMPATSDREGFKTWITNQVDAMASHDLFFANWWQVVLPGFVSTIEFGLKQSGTSSREIEWAKGYARAVGTVRANELVFRNADGDVMNVLTHLPPAKRVSVYHWDSKKVELLTKEGEGLSDIGEMYEMIKTVAYEKSSVEHQGWMIAEAMSSDDETSWTDFSKEVAKSYAKKRGVRFDGAKARELLRDARVAFSVFVMEESHEWLRYLNVNKSEYLNGRMEEDLFPWFVNDVSQGNPWASGIKYRGRDQQDRIREGKMAFDHPLLYLLRPSDLMRIKGVYTEDLLVELERSLMPVGAKGFCDKDGYFKPFSKINLKSLKRYSEGWSIFTGGPQAPDLDSFEKFYDGVKQLHNMWGNSPDRPDSLGACVGDLFAVKVRALMKGKKNSALLTLANFLALDEYSGPKEMQVALAATIGSGLDSDFGQLSEISAGLNLNIRTRNFEGAMASLITGVPDREKARRAIKSQNAVIVFDGMMNIFDAMFGPGRRKK